MFYLILIISVIAIFLVRGYISASKKQLTRYKEDHADISKELMNSNQKNESIYQKESDIIVTPNNNPCFSEWKENHDSQIKEEEDKLINGYYDKYRYIEFDVAGIYYRTSLAKETILSLDILSDIHFIKEPNNPYDKTAIKIIHNRKRFGYVPASESPRITELIDNNQIYKILIIDSGKDVFSEYSDALFITIRVYYTPTDIEIKLEEEKRIKEKEKEELKLKKLLEPVELPQWVHDLIEELKNISAETEEQKWILKKLRDNIRNSIKSYEKAIREEKEIIANNALNRLMQYRDELHKLVNK